MNRILLAVGLQDAFAVEPYYSKCIDYIKKHTAEYTKVIHTYFANPRMHYVTGHDDRSDDIQKNKNFKKYIGYTEEGLSSDDLMRALHDPDSRLKSGYLIQGNICDISSNEYLPNHCHYDLIGCDTDACIMGIAFQLFDNEYDFSILTEYCYSSGGKEYHDMAVKLMQRNFGSAVVLPDM